MKESNRKLKKRIKQILIEKKTEPAMDIIKQFSSKTVINILFSFLLETDRIVKFRAISIMGLMVSDMAKKNMEPARIIMRRLMWSLNDESGGIGWGAPEAMGAIMANSKPLCSEYNRMLISYINPEGNYLEYEPLRQGAVWAVGRAAINFPELFKDSEPFLISFLSSSDPVHVGLSLWALSGLDRKNNLMIPENLFKDNTEIEIFMDDEFRKFKIKHLANLL